MSGQPNRTGHVVVCGSHDVALRTIEQLHGAGVAVVVVADRASVDPLAERVLGGLGVPVVGGRPGEALVEAGIAGAAAVVCLPDGDLRALEIALLARRLRPDVRVVVRMSNTAVGAALAELSGHNSVLDVAALAAPSVMEACLGSRPHPIELGGRRFLVAELTTERDGSLRELYGPLAPLAVEGPPADLVVCPGRDHRVRAGERVVVVGTLEQYIALGLAGAVAVEPPRYAAGARGGGRARAAEREAYGGRAGMLEMARTLLAEADRPLRATLLVLLGLLLVSVAVLRLGYVKSDGTPMTLLDAAYFTVETIGTIGYGDFSFAEQAPWLRLYAIGLMVLGVALAAIWFALLTELLVSRRITRSFGRRRAGSLRRHVIVVGLGAVGVRVVEGLLAAGSRVVVLERDEANRHLSRVRGLGVPVVIGDATEARVLTEVNLTGAAAIAVLTSDDLANIETGLAVRNQLGQRWAQVPVVLRVFDHELGEAISSAEQGFDFRWVRSTAALAAPWFVGAALGLDVLGTFYVGRLPFMVARLLVAEGSGLDGLAMGELSARTRVVAIRRAPGHGGVRALEYPPRSGTRFLAGDDAYLVGPYEELLAVLRRDALAPGAILAAEPPSRSGGGAAARESP